jgi:hypothetical protein
LENLWRDGPYPVKPITITPKSACTIRTGYIHGRVIFDMDVDIDIDVDVDVDVDM